MILEHLLYQFLSLNRNYLINGPLDIKSSRFYEPVSFRNSQSIYFSQMTTAKSLLFFMIDLYCIFQNFEKSHALEYSSLNTFSQSKKCHIFYILIDYLKLFYQSLSN
jgi:hypothetical protein